MDEGKVNESISSKFEEKEAKEILEKQWTHWKLILELSLICRMVRFYSDETIYLENEIVNLDSQKKF
jgi:hypothetical protein